MNILSRMPIKYLLVLIVFIVALPTAGIIIYAGIQHRNEAMNAAWVDTQKLAERMAYEQQSMVASTRQLMASLSQMPEVKQKNTVKVTSLLRDLHKVNPEYTNLFIADRSGSVWATAVPVKPPFIVADRKYFKNSLASGQLSSGEYIIARAGNRHSFTLGYPIKDEQGNVTGVIGVGFLLEQYTQLLDRSKLPKNASFVLLDHKGVILFRAIEPEKYIGKQSDPILFKKIQGAPDESTSVGVSVAAGDKRIITTRKLRLPGEAEPYMYIRVGIPIESALENANTHLLNNLAIFSIVFILALLFSSLIGKRTIVDRIALLEKASQDLSEGNYQIKIFDLVKGGELGRLAESFDSMASKLIQREETLACDIELRKKSEEALMESEFFFRESQRAASTGSYKADFVMNKWESSEVLDNIFGIDKSSERSINDWLEIVHPDDRDMMDQYLREEVISNRKPFSKEYRVIRKNDGEIRWVNGLGEATHDADGNILSLFGTIQDITERKNAEEALRESDDRFQNYIMNAPHAIFVCDETGHYVDVNPAACSMTGFTASELLNMSIPDLLPSESLEWATNSFQQIQDTGRTSGEAAFRKKSGEICHWSLSGVRLSPTRFIAFVNDITDRKKEEEERARLEKQVLHTQKLESLGVLAGGIAHDFNNILMSIIGNADLALMRINPSSPAVENLRRIEQASARAADLAKQMLAYSGKGKFVIESINLNILLEEMLHMLEVSISKKVILRFNYASILPSVEADATQMRQIIMNLVINASEAIGEKSGVIAITTGCMDCDKNYLKDVWLNENIKEGLYIYLEIADTGCGMDKETLAKLFDPFFTTKFTGRGLGMAAVLGIVRGHNGAIKVYSELNKGTSFKILLPASDRPAEIFNDSSQYDEWQGSGKVLLVDDEETVRGIGKEMLQELGFTAVTANDGREAVAIFKCDPEISFVILDLTMPHMDGEQCFRELKLIDPGAKVIMSSGYNEQEVTQKFAGKGLAGFIQKPYKLSVLKEAIRKMI